MNVLLDYGEYVKVKCIFVNVVDKFGGIVDKYVDFKVLCFMFFVGVNLCFCLNCSYRVVCCDKVC